MGRGVDVVKREEWRSRFRRFSKLGLTVAEFCDWERRLDIVQLRTILLEFGVSLPEFSKWLEAEIAGDK